MNVIYNNVKYFQNNIKKKVAFIFGFFIDKSKMTLIKRECE